MLCDVCKIRAATIHVMTAESKGSTVSRETAPIKHFCLDCFEVFKSENRPKRSIERSDIQRKKNVT